MNSIRPTSISNFISTYSFLFAIGIGLTTVVSLTAQYAYTWQPDLVLSQVLIGVSTIIAPFAVKNNEIKITNILPILEKISSNSRQKQLLFGKIKKIENSHWANIWWYVKKCVKFQVAWSRSQGQRYFSS